MGASRLFCPRLASEFHSVPTGSEWTRRSREGAEGRGAVWFGSPQTSASRLRANPQADLRIDTSEEAGSARMTINHPRLSDAPLRLVGIAALALASFAAQLPAPATALAADALVAHSVCEAHELRARKEADPSLQIEIPQEFDTPWPSRDACLSHAAALDESTPGLVQPIPFSHKHHAGKFKIDCQYCHSGTDRSPSAGVPSVELCMGCHSQFPASYDELSGIRTLKEHWETRNTDNPRPIEWLQIHRLPEYVQFRHNRHIRAGVECQQCHGLVQEEDKVVMLKDTKWWPWGLPTQTLEMGWCIQCHREKQVSQDCYTCHY